MNEIYWITRLDSLSTWFSVMTYISGIFAVCLLVPYLIQRTDYLEDHAEKDRNWMEFWSKCAKVMAAMFFICTPLSILTPTTKEAMLIWGVGTTIDFIQENETVQQLPDKCVDALNAWVDSLNEEKKE